MKSSIYGRLGVCAHPSRTDLGAAAARSVASAFRTACALRGAVRAIFACAPSQNEFLDALVTEEIEWEKVTVFHMDEYVGLPETSPQSFRSYLNAHLLSRVPRPRAVHLIRAEDDPQPECERYSALLAEQPIDLVCLGIGENGHLAFNDPPVADFQDPNLVKVVKLDDACRRQQVNDGCFETFAAVPAHAITLTVPALFGARVVSCVVPGNRKAEAVRDTLLGPIRTACPASILRTHPNAILHLDRASASLLPQV